VRTHQVPPKGDSSHPRKLVFFFAPAGLGRSSEDSETIAARQTKRIDLFAARAKAPKARNSQRKNLSNSVITPSPHSLIEQPGTRTGAASPEGETAQGPSASPVDYSLEVEVDLPRDLVSTMKESAAKKTRRTVIGRTLGGRVMLKSLLDCLKLHLPIPLVSITLLTRGYFEILFEEEEGAKATRRLTAIKWSGLSLSFSHYAPNFDASAQGAEAQLTHAIRVQFPDLHEEFKNTRVLTLMASKLREVLEIEAADLYIKRPAGPMIMIELRNISRLPGYIRIPSMAEGSEDTATIAQKNLYSGLPNQCKKCRRFGHHARTCNTGRIKPREEAPTLNPSILRGENRKKSGGAEALHLGNNQADKQLRGQNARNNQEQTGTNHKQPESGKQARHPARPNIRTTSNALPNAEAAPRSSKDIPGSLETDQAMADPTTPPGTRQGKLSPTARTRLESPLLEQPNFGYRSEAPPIRLFPRLQTPICSQHWKSSTLRKRTSSIPKRKWASGGSSKLAES